MNNKKEDGGLYLFIGICLISLGMSLLGNMLIEYFSK